VAKSTTEVPVAIASGRFCGQRPDMFPAMTRVRDDSLGRDSPNVSSCRSIQCPSEIRRRLGSPAVKAGLHTTAPPAGTTNCIEFPCDG